MSVGERGCGVTPGPDRDGMCGEGATSIVRRDGAARKLMADPQSTRSSGDSAHGRGDSQLRIVRPPVVLPEGDAEPSDDAPTVISKKSALEEAVQALPATDAVAGSLRGRTLAHFELLEPIGVGGMAAVLRARDKQLDRFVALKILPPDMAKDAENVQRFHQEARAAARLDHENIARVFFCGDDQKLHFIAFEFVEGENLRTILDRRGRLPVREAVRYMLQIAAGLEHAASRGVVHRDIKPSNIIITPAGRAKLVDMGLARNMGPQTDGLTQSGVTLGTFDYISPEQALEPRDAHTRSDIYSLGCTFYHMLTGQAPVPDGTAAKKLHHHQHVPPVDPRQLNPDIPDDLAAILGRMMAKEAKDRYQRPVQLVQHLMQVAQKVGAGEDVPEGVLFVDAPLPSVPRQRPLLVLAAGLLALGAIVLLLSLFNSDPAPANRRAAALDKKPLIKEPVPKNPFPPVVPGVAPTVAPELEKLGDAFKPGSETKEFKLATDVDLGEKFVLTFDGDRDRALTVEAEDANEPRTVTMDYKGQDGWTAGIWVKRGTLRFRNINFEMRAPVTSKKTSVAAIAVSPAARVIFENCT